MARPTGRIRHIKQLTIMRSVYDAIATVVALFTSRGSVNITDTTLYTSAAIDTKGYNSAMMVGHAGMDNGSCTTFPIAFLLQESDASGSGFAAANDNTGTQIGFTISPIAADVDGSARIEGLGDLNRKRYLKVTMQAGSITGGSSPASRSFCTIVLGRAYNLPANTGVSNT